ncbi:MAG: helix-turn-helix transcriptional regulator [Alphaproteobacteria bacterium]|jgi:AraC-like DNA-binding protein/quercetin dioxygenase-like cupin family protein
MAPQRSHSTDPDDYQHLPQSIGAMSKHFTDGFETPLHHHARDQLLHAARGIMRLRTEQQAWIVPRDSAVYIPAGTPHAVSMHGAVEMRTLYIDTAAGDGRPRDFRVVAVSNLLRELILALGEEAMDYDPTGRGGLIAQMIALEISRARELTLNVPLPKDPRLQRLCAELLADLSDRRTLEAWAEVAGASARTLARLFKHDLGMSFNRWRQRIRFHGALDALSRGQPIATVAHGHGYRSASAFSAAYRREMGIAPSKVAALR